MDWGRRIRLWLRTGLRWGMPLIVFSAMVISLSLLGWSWYFGHWAPEEGVEPPKMTLEQMAATLTGVVVIIGVAAGYYQFWARNERERRERAFLDVLPAFKRANKSFRVMAERNPEVDLEEMKLRQQVLPVSTIHRMICEENDEGDLVTAGDEVAQFVLSKKGRKTRNNIQEILNEYERIALGIFRGIYDEEIVKAYIRGAVLTTWRFFSGYIAHRRKDHNQSEAWVQLEALAARWQPPKRKRRARIEK